MIKIDCPDCVASGYPREFIIDTHGDFEMKGVIKCLRCGLERPFALAHEYFRELSIPLPGEQSSRLHSSVPSDIKEDIQEAEKAHYAQCYKATVTMCRRAVQLALIDNHIKDGPLGRMLRIAKNKGLLNKDTHSLATSIKHYGDIGAHRRELLELQEVPMVIYMAVKMLNELFK
jgi:hypothetical protein